MNIGLSLSFCVGDILRGTRRIEEVDHIISCTAFCSVKEAYDHYKETYWYDFSENDVLATLMAVWPKLVQPRLEDRYYRHSIAQGHWIEASSLQAAQKKITRFPE